MDSSTTYRLIRKIGQGSASEVFLAHAVLPGGGEGAPVAIKRILPLMASNPVLMKRFARQAKLCLPLAHRNLVRLLDYGTYAERQHLVMEYVEGASLAALRVAAIAGEKLTVGEEDMAKLLGLALPGSATPPTPELGEEMTLELKERAARP